MPSSSPASPPVLPVCHLCGRQFGTTSLAIHLRTCEHKYEQEHGKKAPAAPSVPQMGTKAATIEAHNEAAYSVFQDEALEPCPRCARTFLPDRLVVHLRSCTGNGRRSSLGRSAGEARPATSHGGSGSSAREQLQRSTSVPGVHRPPRTSASVPASPPVLPVCHLCGRQFGTTSLAIHLRTCEHKYEQEHGKKAPAAPSVPQMGNKAATIEAHNEAAYSVFHDEALEPCPRCARTFLPDRLVVHLRSCTGNGRRSSLGRSAGEARPATSHGGSGSSAREQLQRSTSVPGVHRPPRTSASVPASPPVLPVCHLCGRQFGTTSLAIHLRTCEHKYEQEHGKKAPAAPSVPQMGTKAATIEAHNEAAYSVFHDEALEPCPRCARTFLPDRLVVHLRSCTGNGRRSSLGRSAGEARPATSHGGSGSSAREQLQRSTSVPGVRRPPRTSASVPASPPVLPVCHLCGRQFGTTSLAIHLRTCEHKYEQEHGKKAPAAPSVPQMGNKAATIEAHNEAAYSVFQDEALEPCPRCARTFLPDRLVVHLRSCTGNGRRSSLGRSAGEARPATSHGGSGSSARELLQRSTSVPGVHRPPRTSASVPASPPVLPVCHLCGRQFGTTSLAIHLRTCEHKYEQEHGKKAPAAPSVPQMGTKAATIEAHNEAAYSVFQDEALEPCPRCARTFLPDRLVVHLRSCTGNGRRSSRAGV